MRSENSSNTAVIFATLVFVLFGTYVSYAVFLTGQPKLGMSWVSDAVAKDGEDNKDGGESEDSKDSQSEDDNKSEAEEKDKEKSEDKAIKKVEKKKKEAAEETEKRSKESAKQANGQGGVSDDMVNDVKLRGDGSVDDDQELSESSEMGEDDSLDDSEDSFDKDEEDAMYKDKTKTLERINKQLTQAEEKILKKQAEGVDVTTALAALALAKEKATGVDALFANYSEEEVKALTKETEQLAHAARGKVLHAAEKVSKDVGKVDKRISQVKEKIATLSAAGGDGSSFSDRLSEFEIEWAALKAKIQSGGDEAGTAYALVETMERRVKSLKSAVENALLALGVPDDTFEMEHIAEVEDASDEIDDLAEIEFEGSDGNSGISVKRITKAHRSDAAKTISLKQQFENRSVAMRQLFGDDRSSLNELRGVIVSNEARIAALQQVVLLMDDPEIIQTMNDKISVLQDQNTELENYVASRPVTSGMFGWLFNWL